MKRPRISVMGIGYVGLCTAVGFASKRYKVIASTHDEEKAKKISKGIPPFYEPKLTELLKKTVRHGFLKCLYDQPEQAVVETDITFNAMGTPSKPDGSIDLQHIESSTQEIGAALGRKDEYHMVVIKSTVVPGTTEGMVKPILEGQSSKHCGSDFGLCMNPEFLRQGSALEDALNPDRIVIGEYDKTSGDILESLYKEFYREKVAPIVRTNLSTAELVKYANNAFLAAKISLINTIANLCEKTPKADVTEVAKTIGLDKRIGPLFLSAGLGYGGSCFPKDVKALIAYSRKRGYHPELLEAVENVNENQPLRAVQLCQELLGNLKGKRICVLGLSFKPNTDDMRESRSIPIINRLLREGANITAYDPVTTLNAKSIFKDNVKYASSVFECLKNADCCVLVTEWDQFKRLKPEDFTHNMKNPILIDGRRIFDPDEFSKKLRFVAIGRGD